MKDIANEVGVSRATVSYVLNGKCGDGLKISETMIEKVRETAERLGYVRNELVQSIVTGKSRVIAVISNFYSFMMPVIKGCVEEASLHNCIIKLIPTEDDINRAIQQAVKYRVAGIFAVSLPPETIKAVDPRFFELGIPSIGLVPETGRLAFDQKASARRGTEYLIQQGLTDILFLTNSNGHYIAKEREAGYVEAMERLHLPTRIVPSGFSDDALQATLETIIDMHPAAVQCANDILALDLINACYRRRLFIPDYFSIIGFSNVAASFHSSPRLTTINEPFYETGKLMFQQIYQLIFEGKNSHPKKLIGEVIERDSVRKKRIEQ